MVKRMKELILLLFVSFRERMFVKCSEQLLAGNKRSTKVLAKEKHESSAFMSNRYVSFYKGVKCVEEVMGGEPFSKQVLSPLNSDPGRYQRGAGASGQRGATTVTRAEGPTFQVVYDQLATTMQAAPAEQRQASGCCGSLRCLPQLVCPQTQESPLRPHTRLPGALCAWLGTGTHPRRSGNNMLEKKPQATSLRGKHLRSRSPA